MYKRKQKPVKQPLATSTQLSNSSSLSSSLSTKRKIVEEHSTPGKRTSLSLINTVSPFSDKTNKIKEPIRDKSEITTQRFVSQSKSYFEKVLNKAGFILSVSKDEAHCLNIKQMLFVHKVEEILQDDSGSWTSNGNVKKFMKDLKDYLDDEENFLKALQSTQWSQPLSQDGMERSPQSSLLHLLLLVKCIQADLLKYIFEKADRLKNQRTSNVNDIHILQLLFRQLRFIGAIVDEATCIESYFHILENSEHNVQVEMVSLFRDIFSPEYHNESAKKFQSLLVEGSKLTPAVLEVLSQLTLSLDLQVEYVERMLEMLPKISIEYLPVLIKFLLTNVPMDYLSEVVNGLRKCELNPKNEKKKSQSIISEELKSIHVLAIENLRSGLMMSRPVTQQWLKTIKSIHNSDKHTVMDIVFLLLIHSTTVENKKVALTLIKNRFQSGIFTTELVEMLFNKHILVVEKYLSDVLSIASSFLNSSRDSSLLAHGVSWFRLCLSHLKDAYCEKVLLQLVDEAMRNSPTSSRASLELLIESISADTSKFAQHGFCILKLLPTVFSCEIMECCQIMDLVSRLAYSKHGHQMNIDDNISQHIRKMLLSCDKALNAKGIVSGILAAKNIALDEYQYDLPRDISELLISISDEDSPQHLTARGYHAKKLLDSLINVVGSSSSVEGLFFEHLSTVISSEDKLDDSLLRWLYCLVESDFKEHYANATDEPLQNNMSRQHSLDETNGICIEIAVKVKKENKAGYVNSRFSMVVLYPLFRLFRILTRRTCGDLSGIDGVLSCSVVMPSSNLYEDFYTLDPDVQKYCVDCIFNCINWFIEVVNAFVGENDKFISNNVCLRMDDIVNSLEKLSQYIILLPDYKPPVCTFYTVPTFKPLQPAKNKKSVGKPKSKKKSKTNKKKKDKKMEDKDDASISSPGNSPDLNMMDDSDIDGDDVKQEARPDFTWLDLINSSCRYFFRELDVEVFKLLNRKLDIQNETDVEGVLSSNALLFLLIDFVAKVEYKLPAHTKKVTFLKTTANKDMLFSNLLHYTPLQFAQIVVQYASALCDKLEVIFVKSKNLIDHNGTILDGREMFTGDTSNLKLCCAYVLQALGSLFSWESFHLETTKDLLQDALRQIASHSNHQYDKLSFNALVEECCNYVLCYKDMVLDIHSARYLVRLAEVIISFSDSNKKLKHKLAATCHGYLTHAWFSAHDTEERGATYNKVIESFMKTYLNNVKNSFDVVVELIDTVASEMDDLTGQEGKLKSLRSINKSNFNVLISNILSSLVSSTSEKLKSGLNDEELISVWSTVSISLKKVIEEIIHKQHTQPCVLAFTKNCLPILKLYISECLPLWEKLFASQPTEFVTEVGHMQTFFRYINVICNHAKRTENASLLKYVPDLREASMKLIYTMKGSLAFNQCTDAFFLGYLKDRDLKGAEIPSQEYDEEGNEDKDNGGGDDDDEEDSSNESTTDKVQERVEADDELSGEDLDSADEENCDENQEKATGSKGNKSASMEY